MAYGGLITSGVFNGPTTAAAVTVISRMFVFFFFLFFFKRANRKQLFVRITVTVLFQLFYTRLKKHICSTVPGRLDFDRKNHFTASLIDWLSQPVFFLNRGDAEDDKSVKMCPAATAIYSSTSSCRDLATPLQDFFF